MVAGLPRNAFVFMEFEDGGGIPELAALVPAASELNVAKLVEGLLKLPREAGAVEAEAG